MAWWLSEGIRQVGACLMPASCLPHADTGRYQGDEESVVLALIILIVTSRDDICLGREACLSLWCDPVMIGLYSPGGYQRGGKTLHGALVCACH